MAERGLEGWQDDLDTVAEAVGFQRASDFCDASGNVFLVLVRWSPFGTYVANAVSYEGQSDRGTLKLTFMHPDGSQEHGEEFECGLEGWERDETRERDPNALVRGRTMSDLLRDAAVACEEHRDELARRHAALEGGLC